MAAVRDAPPRWEAAAAASFTQALPAPAVAGASSTRAYRDIKGWIAGLVHAVHALRWAALAAAIDAAVANGSVSAENAVCAVTRAIIERVVVRQPEESRRIVTSNARRQCARKKGRLSLIRLVDLALALARLRLALAQQRPDDYVVAHTFWRLVECLRGLRAVHEMDSTARSIDLSLFDPMWPTEHASDDSFSLDSYPPGLEVGVDRAERTEKIIRFAVFRASRMESDVDCAPRSLGVVGFNIVTAAIVSDFEPERALRMADFCVDLRDEAILRIKNGAGPVTLKEMRLTLFCNAVLNNVVPETERAHYMAKLAQLFVPVGWHLGGVDHAEGLEWLRKRSEEGNFSAQAALGRRLARCGDAKGYHYLTRADQMGDVAAPIVLGDLCRDGAFGGDPRPETARKYYQTAMSRGSALAALNLGTMYLEQKFPEHITDSGKKAAEHFQCSVDRGNALAALRLARLLHNGAPGQPQDVDRAVLCYSIAKDNSTIPLVVVDARIELARIAAERGEIRSAVGLLEWIVVKSQEPQFFAAVNEKSALKSRLATVLCALARHYRDLGARGTAVFIGSRRYSSQELLENSCSYYRRAAELASSLTVSGTSAGDRDYPVCASSAWYGLGLLRLEMGDITDAIVGFRNAMFAGHRHAPHNLGNLLLKQGHLQAALTAFEEGARRGDSAAANNAAQLTIQVSGDVAAAQMWYERATELGSTTAPANLARLLALGRSNDMARDLQRAKELVAIARERGQNDGMDDLIRTIDELGVSIEEELTGGAPGNLMIEMRDVQVNSCSKVLESQFSPIDVRDKTDCVPDVVMKTSLPSLQRGREATIWKREDPSHAVPSPRKRGSPLIRPEEGLKQSRNRAERRLRSLELLPAVPVSHPWAKRDLHAWMRGVVSPVYSFAWRELAERRAGDSVTLVMKVMARGWSGTTVHDAKCVRAIIRAAQAVLRGKCFMSRLYKWRAIAVPRHVAFGEVVAAQVFRLEHRYMEISSPARAVEFVAVDEEENECAATKEGSGWVPMEF